MRNRPVLTPEQMQVLTDAVSAAESKTSGEIVPVVLRRSDRYPGARWRCAIAFAGLCAFALVLSRPMLHPIWYLWVQVPALAIGYALGSIAGLQRVFLSSAEMDEETHQRAIEAFYLHGLNATRDRTGVLILVSLLEHRVRILADTGISSKVQQAVWDGVVGRLTERLRAGELCEGLARAIAECGEILAGEFPPRPDDRNELPDRPIISS
jgi:putative membrane protein